MKTYLVLDIGGSFIKYALMNEERVILTQGKVPSPQESMDALLEAMKGIREKFDGQYEGVAVSMPGRIDTKKGIAHTGGAFWFIKEATMGELLEKCFGKPVICANDAKCAASAELGDGAFADVDSGVILVLGTGVGGGVVIDHKVWMGRSFAAGELSWFPYRLDTIDPKTHESFGNIEIWTQYISVKGLMRLWGERKQVDPATLDGIQFFEAYDAGEQEAIDALEQFGTVAAAGIFGIQSVLDVERFAIGGGICARPEITDVIRRKLDEIFALSEYIPYSKPDVVVCKYGNDANLIGALNFMLER